MVFKTFDNSEEFRKFLRFFKIVRNLKRFLKPFEIVSNYFSRFFEIFQKVVYFVCTIKMKHEFT